MMIKTKKKLQVELKASVKGNEAKEKLDEFSPILLVCTVISFRFILYLCVLVKLEQLIHVDLFLLLLHYEQNVRRIVVHPIFKTKISPMIEEFQLTSSSLAHSRTG